MDVKVYKHINLDYMDMMSDGDESMKKIMLEMLLEELPEEIEKMEKLFQAADWSELGSVSHKMKSTLAFVGNEQMTEANRQIEHLAKEASDLGAIQPLMNTLVELSPKALLELQEEMSKL